MYNKQQTIALQNKTTEWISKINAANASEIGKDNIENLRNCLRFHEYRYYVMTNPLISDFEYDAL